MDAPLSPDGKVRIAITMDDLLLWRNMPMAPGYTLMGITRAMTAALARHEIKGAYAFSGTAPAQDDPRLLDVLETWAGRGHFHANHTHHHANINWLTLPKYLDDIERTEEFIAPWAGAAPKRLFRYCMDNWGNTPEKHAGVQAYLARHGYTAAPISLWFYDVEFLAPHWRAVTRGDREAVNLLRRAFADTAVAQARAQAAAARAMFGRDPAHVWLIHGTPLAADALDEILDRFEAAGAEFISLEEALEDPMNRDPVPIVTPRFLNQVQKWAALKDQPIEDCPPAVIEWLDTVCPMEGESTAEVMGRVFRAICDSMEGEWLAKQY